MKRSRSEEGDESDSDAYLESEEEEEVVDEEGRAADVRVLEELTESELMAMLVEIRLDPHLNELYVNAKEMFGLAKRVTVEEDPKADWEMGRHAAVEDVQSWEKIEGNVRVNDELMVLQPELLTPRMRLLGRVLSQEIWARRSELHDMKRGKAHSHSQGRIVQFGLNAGQIGRAQAGFCSNSARFPDLHKLASEFVSCQWTIMLALNEEHCKQIIRECISGGVPFAFPGTRIHTLGVSLNYVDPLHRDKNDFGWALLTLFGAKDVEEYFTFPDLRMAVPFVPEQSLLFKGSELRHATTEIIDKRSKKEESLLRVGFGVQTSRRAISAFSKKGDLLSRIPPEKVLLEWPPEAVLRLFYLVGGHCNGSLSFSPPSDLSHLADVTKGFTISMVRVMLRWMCLRHLMRNTLGIHRLIRQHCPQVRLWLRNGDIVKGRLRKETQRGLALLKEKYEAGEVVVVEFMDRDEDLAWLIQDRFSAEWNYSEALPRRDAIWWPAHKKWFWGFRAGCMFLYDDLTFARDTVLDFQEQGTPDDCGQDLAMANLPPSLVLAGAANDKVLFWNPLTGQFFLKGDSNCQPCSDSPLPAPSSPIWANVSDEERRSLAFANPARPLARKDLIAE